MRVDEGAIFCDFPIGDLAILKGFPGIGKTTYALSLALSLAQSRRNSVYFSLGRSTAWIIENMKRQVGERVYQELKERIVIDDTASISIREVRSRLAKVSANYVFVDSLQFLSVSGCTSRKAELEIILQELQSIAVEYNVAVIATYQISKGLRLRHNVVVDELAVDIEGVHIYLLEEVHKFTGEEALGVPQVRLTKQGHQVLEVQALPKHTRDR